ncbi:tRNA uridine-5-carboxymethylaminomethyl(34) synthesis GTPase MnmE [Nitrospira moscoviensis]|uniref:tRNA modification GTPase MnmE n=1 Tax=Nitrospira moscoviensis TaxID=42253 RepID=A0A0K2G715_NITMO|nr:tRNA uridine-5-carboxymethylaminomethyl(34) synthesis GTPase MnmE [Nitrospira moscoviensis]ALA56725.1 GTPase [Nitrospira moscoviensis]
MDQAPEETICAIATPPGEGGVGIVRISGAGALQIAEKVVRLRSGLPLASVPSHTLHLADISATGLSGSSSPSAVAAPLDEGLVVYMAAPRSYTAEDVVELHCHGSALVLARVCAACIAAGARLARAGEFTKRAFLNGRIDLSQAEAVLDTIRAKSDEGLRLAQQQLRGDLGREVERLRARLLTLLAHVEAGIDFADESIEFVGRDELLRSLKETTASIEAMLTTCRSGRVLREGARVVIVGRPNVGKSSLLNRLLQEERAIVTSIPGTTRDVIEEGTVLDGVPVTLVDTAGLRETTDEVEQQGIQRAKAAQEEADIILQVLDAAEVAADRTPELPEDAVAGRRLVLLNKMDLFGEERGRRLAEVLRHRTNAPVIPVSAVTGVGLDDVKQGIRSLLSPGSLESRESVVVTNVRHQAALQQAASSLQQAYASIEARIAPECVAVDLRGAADALGEITGAITSTEVLERIFSEFCIGK